MFSRHGSGHIEMYALKNSPSNSGTNEKFFRLYCSQPEQPTIGECFSADMGLNQHSVVVIFSRWEVIGAVTFGNQMWNQTA